MAIPFGSIGQLALGNLVSRGADRLLNPDRVSKNQFNLLTGGGYSGSGEDEEKDKGSKTLGGIAKSGIMSLIANALLGPVFGQLALTLGKNFVNKRQQQGLGLNPFGGDGTPGPAGIMSGKVQTLDGRIVDSDSDEARADLDARDQAFQETGDYDEYSNTVTTGPDYGPVTSGTVFDAEDDGGGDDDSGGGGGGGGGGSPGSAGPGGSDEMGSFRYGGRASYSGGGLASLLQIMAKIAQILTRPSKEYKQNVADAQVRDLDAVIQKLNTTYQQDLKDEVEAFNFFLN